MKASDICFGVEIECYVPRDLAPATGAYHRGLQINWAPEGWNAQRDGSLSADVPDGYVPVEVVSPILSGLDGLGQVAFMLEELGNMRALVSDACGLHIHVDARRLSQAQIASIRNAFVRYERAFYGLNGIRAAMRFNGRPGWPHYCKPSHLWTGDRYQSLNLTNLTETRKRTIEIRVWTGTLIDTEVVTAACMAVALVARAASVTVAAAERIENAGEAAEEFIREYWRPVEYRIVPEANVAPVVRVLRDRCKKAF